MGQPGIKYTDRLCPTGVLTVEENRTYCGIADLDVAPVLVKAESLVA